MRKGQVHPDSIVFRGRTYQFFGETYNTDKDKKKVRTSFTGSDAKFIFRAAPDDKSFCGIFRYYPPRRK
jgi:hypothetical protein